MEIKLNGKKVKANEGEYILDVAQRENIYIPTLCDHPAVKPTGACRMCLVEAGVEGRKKKIVTSCAFHVKQGLEVNTDTPTIKEARKVVMDLLLARAPNSESLKEMAQKLDMETVSTFEPVENAGDCILCGLCTRVCDEVVGANAISFNSRGADMDVGGPLLDVPQDCIGCGACAYVCPTDCIGLKDDGEKRYLEKWDRELPLMKCRECGWPFMPAFQAIKFNESTKVPKDFFKLCPDCRN
ncbi:MAG: 2Fe-2S iron-sulfur cluster-binding protein [Deltaproteobacteria bacterium]|jgi:bidirectional [NiFe] hydrogenase diaphorase subunit|nr:2Fe-2S iron-sulfur cluster-binding protein [Deltaproteobacteria bacterium]